MCGQAGLILAPGRRNKEKLEHLRDVFTRLLALNEFRGKHATGVAIVDDDGSYSLLKKPVKASRFIFCKEYREMIKTLSNRASLLMGHARFATVGCHTKANNNHPNEAGCCLSTMNGTIFNADELFEKFALSRHAEVDSELIAQLADRHAPDGEILVSNFVHSLRFCRGQISAVVASLLDPQRVIILKGNKPLCLRYNANFRAVIYSSEELHLDVVLKNDGNWKNLDLSPMTCAVFDVSNLPEFEKLEFNFIRENRRKISCMI
ncbi:MAG: hypothetical protein A2017_20430 [Lentisphaerae bacterium GWF2_44_16]|nr:MAG: hypothetical protein A2017_20430 [Lentisphaerae bacterium GWF2_44_16]